MLLALELPAVVGLSSSFTAGFAPSFPGRWASRVPVELLSLAAWVLCRFGCVPSLLLLVWRSKLLVEASLFGVLTPIFGLDCLPLVRDAVLLLAPWSPF